MFGSFDVKHNKELWKIIWRVWTPRCCFEIDLVALTIEICQLARQHDQTQKHLLDHFPFHHYFSYYVILGCWIMSFIFFCVICYEKPPKM